MPPSSFLPSLERLSPPLSEADRRALKRFIEQSLGHGFRLAIIEAGTRADREAVLADIAPIIGAGLLDLAIDDLPGADVNLWMALRDQFSAHSPRCLALWGVESRSEPDWPRQLNVQRDLFVRDLAVPWLLFIHPATRVRLLQTAPDFCDFAILWIRDEQATQPGAQPEVMQAPGSLLLASGTAPSSVSPSGPPLLRQAQAALSAAQFDTARDYLNRFDLQADPPLPDRLRRKLLGVRLEREQGHPALAEALLRDVQNTLARLPSTEETQALAQQANIELGIVLKLSGRYSEAETLLRKNLTLNERLGEKHPNYKVLLHSLAGALEGQGKYGEAETLLRKLLAIDEQTLGVDHLNYATLLHALAIVLLRQGKYGEAETLLRKSLVIKEKTLGVEHPNYGASLHTLAIVLESEGKYGEAETLLRKSLTISEKALGAEHPTHGTSLHTLAVLLSRQGKDGEGETLLRKSLAIKEKALGIEHPGYGTSLHALASVLSQQGKYGEAETLLRKALALKEKALGEEHPSLCPTLTYLASVLVQKKRLEESPALVERALSIARKVHSERHPEIGQILLVQARIQAQLRDARAVQTARQAQAILTETLGPTHPLAKEAEKAVAALQTSSQDPRE